MSNERVAFKAKFRKTTDVREILERNSFTNAITEQMWWAFQAGAAYQRAQAQPADALVEALDALIADYDGEIHNEYDGTSMLDSRLSEINYAREALATYRAAQEKK